MNSRYLFILLALLAVLIVPCKVSQAVCQNPEGDLNADNVVDWSDLGIMASQWLQSSGSADLDGSGNVDLIDYAILVSNWGKVGNCSPVVDAGIDQSGYAADVSLAGTVSDDGKPTPPGAVTTTWSKVSGSGTVVFADASVLNTTATLGSYGTYVIRLTANDSALISYDELTIVYSQPPPQNQAPQVNAGTDQSIELSASATLDGTVTDDGLPNPPAAVTTQWTKVSGPNDVTFGDVNAVDTTASFAGPGVYVLKLTASDSVLSADAEVTVTVAPQNAPPTVDAGIDQTVNVDNANLDGTVTDDGLPNPPAAVTTQWTKTSGPNDVVFGDASAIDTTVTFGGYGMYVLRLTANDGEASAYDEVTITYEQQQPSNNPPVVNAGTDQTILLPVDANLCGASVTDDGMPNPPAAVTTLWTKESGPNDVTFDDASAVCATAHFAGPGVYVLRLTANDSALSAYDEVQITVQQNQAPVVNAGQDASITYPTVTYALSGSVTDDGLPGAYTVHWTKQSGTGTVTFSDANSLTPTATFPNAGGVFVLRLTANDGMATSYDEVQITVVGAPQWSESGGYCYVDGVTGSDSAAGTSAAPYKTITKAFSVAGSGRKLVVWGGGGGGRSATQTYTEAMTAGVSGTSSSVITLKRDPASGEAIIDGGATSSGVIATTNGKGYWTIDGFTLTNGTYGIYLYQAGATGWTIKNCRIRGNANDGIRMRLASNNTIDNCAIYSNNTVAGSFTNVYIFTTTGVTITQSTMYNTYIGVQCITGPASITTLKDCIITGSSSNPIKNDSSHSCSISPITYCDVTGTTSGVTLGTGCKTTNPLLVDPANGDLHLGTGSPAHNADSGGGDMGYIYGGQAI